MCEIKRSREFRDINIQGMGSGKIIAEDVELLVREEENLETKERVF